MQIGAWVVATCEIFAYRGYNGNDNRLDAVEEYYQ